MKREVVEALLALNRRFYAELAEPFARSRDYFHPGFSRLLDYLPQPCSRLLDVGCGEGRLGRFLLGEQAIEAYAGVDFSSELLAHARMTTGGDLQERDLSQPDCLAGMGQFPAIVCLSTLQHIPGRANRVQLLVEMAQRLEPDGVLCVANWQFLDSVRQRRKIADWSAIGLSKEDVEENDFLLTWQRGGVGHRYVSLIDAAETIAIGQAAMLSVVGQFRSDGRERNLNLYTVFRQKSWSSRR